MQTETKRKTAGAAPALSVAPSSVFLPLRFVLTGLAALLGATAWITVRPELLANYHYNQQIISLTHLVVLGWIASIVMGSMYQLVPVALETKLRHENLARCQFWLHLIGVSGMVFSLSRWNIPYVIIFGSVVGLAILLFIFNIVRTLASVPRWNAIAFSVASACFWLFFAMAAGLFLASDKHRPFGFFDPIAQMHAHAHLGVLGFFLMMLVGVSYKLVPMFTLSDLQNERRAWASVLLLNVALAGLFFTILVQSLWKPFFSLLFLSGLGVYAIELRAILRARKRRRHDWGLIYFFTALSCLVPVGLLSLVLSWPGLPLTALTGQLENLYGFLGLMGILTLAIMGMLYKIVPFLTWYFSYSSQIGRNKVPALAELYSTGLQAFGYWTYLGAMAALSAGMVLSHPSIIRIGAVILWTSVLIFAVNMGKIMTHFVRPRIEPLIAVQPRFVL